MSSLEPWPYWADLLEALGPYAHKGWVEGEAGGLAVCHQPKRGSLAYLHRLYPPLSADEVNFAEQYYDVALPSLYRAFLQSANGCQVFDCLTLFGSLIGPEGHGPIDRTPHVIGRPISLDYGNIIGRPANWPGGAFAVGGLTGYSGQGRLIILPSGEVILTHPTDATDIAMKWPTFEAMLFSEIDRLARLHDADGELVVPEAERLPAVARRWEDAAR